jgi:hypothetical protein
VEGTAPAPKIASVGQFKTGDEGDRLLKNAPAEKKITKVYTPMSATCISCCYSVFFLFRICVGNHAARLSQQVIRTKKNC